MTKMIHLVAIVAAVFVGLWSGPNPARQSVLTQTGGEDCNMWGYGTVLCTVFDPDPNCPGSTSQEMYPPPAPYTLGFIGVWSGAYECNTSGKCTSFLNHMDFSTECTQVTHFPHIWQWFSSNFRAGGWRPTTELQRAFGEQRAVAHLARNAARVRLSSRYIVRVECGLGKCPLRASRSIDEFFRKHSRVAISAFAGKPPAELFRRVENAETCARLPQKTEAEPHPVLAEGALQDARVSVSRSRTA